jgi:peptidoglycan-associated lipoprotein
MRDTLALIAVAALLAGCPSKPNYPECKIDQDCAEHGQVCLNGFCKECREDANCAAKPGKSLCKNAICVEKQQCATRAECQAGEKCSPAGKCVPECTVGSAAQDCAPGHKCISGRCAAEEECLADADCTSGGACVDKVCKAQGSVMNPSGAQKLGACELKAVLFGFDDATLTPESRKQLDADFQCLKEAIFRRAVVSGHTDERGTTEYNLALGERRAGAVKKYLVDLGLEAARVKAISYGKERPVDPGHDEAAWARNRRVEIGTEQ